MASTGQEKEVKMVSEMSNKILRQYESLQKEYKKVKKECKQMQEERDEALKKLNQFEQVSHKVIEEVNNIQENLEIEKTCRQSVEALASKLNKQNRSLKRKSMLYIAHLNADVVAEINFDDEEDEDPQEEVDVCSSSHCQLIITELRDKLDVILAEKKQIAFDLETTREQLSQTRQELLKEKHDNTVLIAETFQQKKLLGKYNRVSHYALEEFETLQEDLKLERDMRCEAEKFAHEMLIEQKKLKRQSQMLIQSVSPAEALQKALAEINTLTHTLETQRLEHQQQVKTLEEQINTNELKKQLMTLQRQTELLEEERKEWQNKHTKAETEAKDLRFRVEELKKKLQQVSNPPPAAPAPPPPPPPPPPLPPPPAPSSNPLSSLLSILRKKKDISTEIPLVEKDSSEKPPEKDVRQQAVDEMMQRIKQGVQLRRVSQTANRTRPVQKERTPSNSAIQELKGILSSVKRPGPSPSSGNDRPSESPKSELEKALHRRREALKTTQTDTTPSVLDPTQIRRTQTEPDQRIRDQDTQHSNHNSH